MSPVNKNEPFEPFEPFETFEPYEPFEPMNGMNHVNGISKVVKLLYETNYIRHELCALLSAEEQVNQCFEEIYARVSWEDVMDFWYKKVLQMPIVLNPEMLAVFRETLSPKDITYKNRLKKWMIESPTVGFEFVLFNFYAGD